MELLHNVATHDIRTGPRYYSSLKVSKTLGFNFRGLPKLPTDRRSPWGRSWRSLISGSARKSPGSEWAMAPGPNCIPSKVLQRVKRRGSAQAGPSRAESDDMRCFVPRKHPEDGSDLTCTQFFKQPRTCEYGKSCSFGHRSLEIPQLQTAAGQPQQQLQLHPWPLLITSVVLRKDGLVESQIVSLFNALGRCHTLEDCHVAASSVCFT